MKNKKWLVYGANGYTGRMLVYESLKKGLKPVIAGRNGQKIYDLSKETNLPCKIFEVDSKNIDFFLADIDLIVNCAGPFSKTSKPLLQACCHSNTHYIDISGEYSSFEYVFDNSNQWIKNNISVIPGVGLDVVPGDCLAAFLKQKLPDACNLSIGLSIEGTKVSNGSIETFIESIAHGGRIRKNGRLTKVPLAWKTKLIPYNKSQPSLSISTPLAELSSAWVSTRIPNIETYLQVSTRHVRYLKMTRILRPLLLLPPILNWLKKQFKTLYRPPHARVLQKGSTTIWGEVRSADGRRKELRIKTSEAYHFTCESAISIAKNVLNGTISRGSHTPSAALGAEFVLSFDSVVVEDIKPPQE